MTVEKPEQIKEPDLDALRRICQDYIDFIDDDSRYHEDNDYNQYVFETALKTIFGENVYQFINNRRE